VKIAVLSGLYPPHVGGGAEIIAHEIAKSQVALGHELVVFTTHDKPQKITESLDGISVTRIPCQNNYWHFKPDAKNAVNRLVWHASDLYNKGVARWLEEFLLKHSPDVALVHNLPGLSASVWTTLKNSGVPVVQMLHDYYSTCPKCSRFSNGRVCKKTCASCKLYRFCHPNFSSAVNGVIGVSKFILDEHRRLGMFSEAELQGVIYNARDVPGMPASFEPRMPSTTFNFGFIGALTPEKGVELLIESFKLANFGSNVTLDIAGSTNSDYAKSLVSSANHPNIRFLGHTKPENFYRNIDVLVAPSVWNDPLPGVVFEAMAYGLPVIGSKRGGIPEMVTDGVTGFLFEPESPGELAQVMSAAYLRKGDLDLLGKAAFIKSRPFVDTERMAREHLSFYERVRQHQSSKTGVVNA
jgi:glycosyltransferase involved in cell wall biosynthesis